MNIETRTGVSAAADWQNASAMYVWCTGNAATCVTWNWPDDPNSGVREPRRPYPPTDTGGIALPLPREVTHARD